MFSRAERKTSVTVAQRLYVCTLHVRVVNNSIQSYHSIIFNPLTAKPIYICKVKIQFLNRSILDELPSSISVQRKCF